MLRALPDLRGKAGGSMKLLTAEIRAKLITQGQRSAANGEAVPGQRPVVKFFTPWGAATWLVSEITELDDEHDDAMMYGLCDLGQGFPELGYLTLAELQELRGPGPFRSLRVERDMHWTATKSLAEYADEAREAGRIT